MRGFVLGKIAADLDQALARREASGAPGRTTGRLVAGGNGWSVEDVLCTCGPGDRPFEERHTAMSIGVVVCGTFQYRSPLGRDLMTPGSFLLGNAGQCFECGRTRGGRSLRGVAIRARLLRRSRRRCRRAFRRAALSRVSPAARAGVVRPG